MTPPPPSQAPDDATPARGVGLLWPHRRPLIGMIHLLPLPGSPRWGGSMAAVVEQALRDAEALNEAGFDGLLMENFLDAPFFAEVVPAETVSTMTRVATAVRAATELPLGINVLRNDARAALAVAVAVEGDFIRVNVHTGIMWTDQGAVEGRAAQTLRLRAALGREVAILADVLVKHATPPPGLTAGDAARDAWDRGLADGLVVTGAGTGRPASPSHLSEVVRAVPEAPVWVGSGVGPDTVAETLRRSHGAIVGTAVTREGRAGSGVDPKKARALVEAARGSSAGGPGPRSS